MAFSAGTLLPPQIAAQSGVSRPRIRLTQCRQQTPPTFLPSTTKTSVPLVHLLIVPSTGSLINTSLMKALQIQATTPMARISLKSWTWVCPSTLPPSIHPPRRPPAPHTSHCIPGEQTTGAITKSLQSRKAKNSFTL